MDWITWPARAITGITGLIRDWFKRDERKAQEDRGRLQERDRHMQETFDAMHKMADEQPSGKRDTVDRLRGHEF